MRFMMWRLTEESVVVLSLGFSLGVGLAKGDLVATEGRDRERDRERWELRERAVCIPT